MRLPRLGQDQDVAVDAELLQAQELPKAGP